MKILMLTPYLPYPLHSGGQIRTYNLLKNLACNHDITLFSFIRNQDEARHVGELLRYCSRVEVFRRRPAWSMLNILLAAFTPYPFLVSIYYSRRVKRAIKQELVGKTYDLIHAETFYVMPNIPRTQVPMLLVEQTIEFLVYHHFVQQAPWYLRPVLSFDVFKIKFWEKFFWKKAQKVIAMSPADASVMQSEIAGLDAAIVPNGVDSAFFSQKKHKTNSQKRVLFVGNFKWLQNREAARVLISDIWPKIRRQLPEATLSIVGRFFPENIKNFDRENGIHIFDSVDDIRDAYTQADVLLAPIRGPGGTRYKILEAMASGVPVVTTRRGIEGLGAQGGIDALIAESADQLAKHTVLILKNPQKAVQLAQSGRRLVNRQYRWELIAEKLDHIYREVAHG